MSQTPHGVNFEAHRPVVMGRNGMVCAGQPLASQAGINILQKGGNAFAFLDGASRPTDETPQYLNHFALPVAT